MEAEYDRFEIVRILRGFKLVDPESYERRYRRRDGRPLAPGYYVVNWPESVVVRKFDEHPVFYGPFQWREDAQAFLAQVQMQERALNSTAAPQATDPIIPDPP
jgi:hypothetical protein